MLLFQVVKKKTCLIWFSKIFFNYHCCTSMSLGPVNCLYLNYCKKIGTMWVFFIVYATRLPWPAIQGVELIWDPLSCVELTDDEFVPPQELMEESSSEGSVDVPAQAPMKRKKRKPLRTSKRAKQTITCSDKDSRSTENEEETNTGKVSAMKLQKKEDGEFTGRSIIVFIVRLVANKWQGTCCGNTVLKQRLQKQ